MKKTLALTALVSALTTGCGAVDEHNASTVKENAPTTCSIQTSNGRYLSAVGGGGRITDVIHTDATQVRAWEKFTLIDTGVGSPIVYGIRTATGNFLTAVSGGGRITDVIHSDASQIRGWEKFVLEGLGGDWYAIRTADGRYLTAVGGGGRITDTIHSDATQVRGWEKFKFRCGL